MSNELIRSFMNILVFKTSLQNRKDIHQIAPALNNNPLIIRWSVDIEDWERILRIEAKDEACELEIAECIRALGYDCEDLGY